MRIPASPGTASVAPQPPQAPWEAPQGTPTSKDKQQRLPRHPIQLISIVFLISTTICTHFGPSFFQRRCWASCIPIVRPHCAKCLVHFDVVDAAAFSSTCPCACGSRLCHANQLWDLASGGCTAAEQLIVTMDPQGIDCDVFTGWGASCAGASSYSDGLHYVSHDRCCDGGSSSPSWTVAFTKPDLNADKALDQDGVCGGLACIFTGGGGFWVLSEDMPLIRWGQFKGLTSYEEVGPSGSAVCETIVLEHAAETEEEAPPPRRAAMPLQEEARVREEEAIRRLGVFSFAVVAIRRLGVDPVQQVFAFAGV